MRTFSFGLSSRLFVLLTLTWLPPPANGDDFDAVLKPLFQQRCAKCHGGDEVNGKFDTRALTAVQELRSRPELIQQLAEVLDARDMPPEGEPQLSETVRVQAVAALKKLLREATRETVAGGPRVQRLNRFQYNYSVRDLFQLDRDVYPLPEKLMTRHEPYLASGGGRVPDQVQVASEALSPPAGLRGVKSYPKDLRAAHGFDNQADQLTLSPLLLDAFLRLSVSVVESPDFNSETVGIWQDFFAEPAGAANVDAELRRRLAKFLRQAFREPVDAAALDRYAAYATAKLKQGFAFPEAMKKVASAVLSSPRFLLRAGSPATDDDPFELASRLSYFLWSSGPDEQLLALAEAGTLSAPETLRQTFERMLRDPKIERFLDSFPAQWMQLENLLAATPDPAQARLFNLDPNHPASLQMILEPLLLFDTVFVENRPVGELITPAFSYRSEFLRAWYNSDLKPPPVDVAAMQATNRKNAAERERLTAALAAAKAELAALLQPVRQRILAERKARAADQPPVDLRPYAAWEFDGDLKSAVNSLDLQAKGKIRFEEGMVVLERAYLISPPLPIELRAKTLELWCQLANLDQPGGGAMGIQGPGDFFDTIVIGERQPRHWISGSNRFARTLDFPESTPETRTDALLHLVMVYQEDGTTALYRDGAPYGKPYRKGAATFPQGRSSVLFGLRHLPAGGNKFLNCRIDKARLYNRALTPAEIAASFNGHDHVISDAELAKAMSPAMQARRVELEKSIERTQTALEQVPAPLDVAQVKQDAQKKFDDQIRAQLRSRTFQRVAATDRRYGGVITNAAMLSMTSGPKRTHPIARGAWIIEVIFNDPPPPPPNDVPPLDEEAADKNLTIREKFAMHRENPNCAGCHSRLDPLGFALENFDIVGRWRDQYANGRPVDASGTLMRKHVFNDVVRFKDAIVEEDRRFAKAFTAHLLRFALARELDPADSLTVDAIVDGAADEQFKLRTLLEHLVLSPAFAGGD